MIDTLNDFMLIEEYEIMLVINRINEKNRRMFFDNIVYVSFTDVILMFVTHLKKQDFVWNMYKKVLMNKSIDAMICDIEKKHDLSLLKYWSVEKFVNLIQSHKKILTKTISWNWHLRLKHCRLKMINQLKKINEIEVTQENASKIVQCDTCAISKMHRLIQRKSSAKAIKIFQILHFDLIICNKAFDETTCIAHFIDELIFYNWVFSLMNHKKKTLLSIFKDLINQCDRIEFDERAIIRIIRIDQKIFIDKKFEDWMREQRISWDWSTKNIFEQNEKFERFDDMLIEKTKCIKKHVKLSKDLYSECYFVVAHILNRMSSSSLSWDSSLIFMQKLLKESIRNEIAHFKMFDCKTFSLLKKTNTFKRSDKMKSRALIEYLIKYDFINIFRIWNSKKDDVNDYRDVIFNETKFFDTYEKVDLFKKEERKFYVTYRALFMQIFEDSDEKQYDRISIRKFVLNNFKETVVSKSMMKKRISSSKKSQLFTFDDTSSFESESESTINTFVTIEISRRDVSMKNKEMIFFSRKNKSLNKENNFSFRKNNFLYSHSSKLSNELFEIENAFLNVLISKNINFRIDEINIVKEKRVRRSSKDFANTIWISEKMKKILVFHTALMIVFNTKASEFIIKTISSFKFHISNFSKSFLHWKAMLRHSHAEEFIKAAQMKYDVIETKRTWKIVDKQDDYKLISLKWIFIYKSDSNDFFFKYKARIVIRNDLQKINNAQNVYAATFASKIFRMMMIFVADFHLKIKQLNAVNVFLNVFNDEKIYYHMSNEYKNFKKILKLFRTLYDQRKSFLLWLRILIDKCIEFELNSIFDEFCLFSNDNEILMFFYVNDIVFAFTASREKDAENLIRRLKDIFDMRNLNSLNFFLDVRILQQLDTIWLIQNFYMNKLIKNYVINIEYKATTLLSYQSLMSYIDEMNQERVHVYRQKMKSICYFVIIIRSNIIKAASELTRHFINFDSKHLKAANHCIKYLHVIKFLIIRYSNSKDEKLSSQISSSNKEKSNKKMSSTSNSKLNKKTSSIKENNDKQIFESTADAFFANDLDRKSAEEYIFKLFDEMIDWAVKKQFIVSIFIIEAKLLSMLHADKKLIWWIHLFQKLKFDSNQKIMIYNDNLQIIRFFISKILKTETKLRHVDIAQCWLKQLIQSDYFLMNYLFIAKMIANELTKILSSQKHREFIN